MLNRDQVARQPRSIIARQNAPAKQLFSSVTRLQHRLKIPNSPAAVRTEISAPVKDATADIMRAVMVLSLQNRLKQYQAVEADVVCDAMGLLEGRFDGLVIEGRHWVTPLNMTAHKLQVNIGRMQIDYGTLITQRKVAMKNIPSGTVRIHLSGKDMGNFLAHPLFQQAAATAVQGVPFHFARDSVVITHECNTGGQVQFTGTWAANNQRYKVIMLPGNTTAAAGGGSSTKASRQRPLQVGAQHICESGEHDLKGAHSVAQGIANFFNNLSLDLQGIELSNPMLRLHPGDVSESQEGDLLEIAMTVKLRAFPPLDMKF